MRSPLLALMLVMPGIHTLAQWTADTQLNTSVRSGAGVDAATPLMSDGPDGSTYVSWFDNQAGGYQLRMQRLDANGYGLWAAEGLVVSDHPQNSALFRYDLKTDHQGNAIVAFQDERSGHLDIVVYKVDPSGTQLWGADGIALTDPASTEGLAPVIGVLADNEVVVAWNADDGTDKWVAVQHLLEDGTIPWATPYQITGAYKYSRPKVIPTSDNGCFVQYVEEAGNFPFTCTMYAQRFDGQGNVVGTFGVSIKNISAFFFPEPIPDGQDGFYLAFTTSNPDNAALSDVYVQRLRGDFSLWSGTGTELLAGTSTQRFTGGLAFLNDIMGLMAPVQVTNAAQSQTGWSVQRLDTAGVVQLGDGGVTIVPLSAQPISTDGIAGTLDGSIVTYSEGGFGQERLRATRLGVAGNVVWGPLDLCTVNSNKDDAACGRLGNNDQIVSVWQDDRSGSGIFAQNITLEGGLGTAVPAASAGQEGLRVRPLGDGVMEVTVFDPGELKAPMRLMDASGGLVRMAAVNNGRAQFVLTSPGVYIAEVQGTKGPLRMRFVTP